MSTRRIAVDAFGGDLCPAVELEAAVRAVREGIEVVLVGDRAQIEEGLARYKKQGRLPAIHHAPDRITMDDTPGKAIRAKPEASMPVCFDLVKAGDAAAVVSAGNSGAMLACGLFKLKRIRGVDRPAIVTSFPNPKRATTLLDMGANVECRPVNLVQFAVMGAVYATLQHQLARPRVAILANGSEDSKGTELTRAAHRVLKAHPSDHFDYVGYIEGQALFSGVIDVVVTDGFTGNVLLKTAEGTAAAIVDFLRTSVAASPLSSKLGALLMRPAFREFKRRADPDTYGGAPLVGVEGIAIICHGGASVKAVLNGIREADRFVRDGLAPGMREAIDAHASLFAAARAEDTN
ncbi:MAG: phosphate acyltransferase PlsX [Nannocystaceae bacterium]|nr:phosphate acyltransferase PlsX [Myxococcales bacterium]